MLHTSRLALSGLLYLALTVAANARDYSGVEALRTGDMQKLQFHAEALPTSEAEFELPDGTAATLADFEGQYVLLNFWATWCAPCRKEMPMLSELQTDFGGDDFQVLTLATGRNPIPALERFFDEIGVDNLPLWRDPNQRVARDMAVLGLPITVIIDPAGQEIARLRGDADWASASAKEIIAGLINR